MKTEFIRHLVEELGKKDVDLAEFDKLMRKYNPELNSESNIKSFDAILNVSKRFREAIEKVKRFEKSAEGQCRRLLWMFIKKHFNQYDLLPEDCQIIDALIEKIYDWPEELRLHFKEFRNKDHFLFISYTNRAKTTVHDNFLSILPPKHRTTDKNAVADWLYERMFESFHKTEYSVFHYDKCSRAVDKVGEKEYYRQKIEKSVFFVQLLQSICFSDQDLELEEDNWCHIEYEFSRNLQTDKQNVFYLLEPRDNMKKNIPLEDKYSDWFEYGLNIKEAKFYEVQYSQEILDLINEVLEGKK